MYSPKISADLIPMIYQKAKASSKPMTKVVDEILRVHLGVEPMHKQVRRVQDGIQVQSASELGVMYLVRNIDGVLTCDCLGFEYRGRCRHIEIVKEVLGDRIWCDDCASECKEDEICQHFFPKTEIEDRIVATETA